MAAQKRIIIAGGRDFPVNEKSIKLALKYLPHKCTLICGDAKGADQLNKRIHEAHHERYSLETFKADWDKYGKGAGHRRNADMGNTATHLLAFWDGESRGTKHMINYARFKGLKVKVIKYTLRPTKKPVQRKGL